MKKKNLSVSDALETLFTIEITSIKIDSYRNGYNDCREFVLNAKDQLVKEHNEKINKEK